MAFAQWVESDTITGAVAIFQLKAMLKLAGWTVEASGDATSYFAASDGITTGAAGAGGMANTRAWFRISNPDGVEYIVQRGTTNIQWRIKVSPVATFVGGAPNATTVPSATDEYILFGGGTDASPSWGSAFSADNGYRYKAGADSASPYHFWSMAFPIGGGVTNHNWIHEGLGATEPTDGAPFHVVIGSTAVSEASIINEAAAGSATRCFAAIAAVTPSAWAVFPGMATSNAPLKTPVNPITGQDESFPIMYVRRTALGTSGYKGIGLIMRWAGIQRTTGNTLTDTTPRDRIFFDSVILPWNGTVPTV